MDQSRFVSPDEQSTRPPGGPEEQPGYAGTSLRTVGVHSLAFGIALGLTLVFLYFILELSFFPVTLRTLLPDLATNTFYSALWYFLIGLISGTFIIGLYNMLVVRRLNLFGLESHQN